MNTKGIETRLSVDLGERVEIEAFGNADFKTEVLDATQKFRVKTPSGSEYFLIISGVGNPSLVKRAVENIQSVHMNVSSDIARHVLQPVVTGEDETLSYAVWPSKPPFLSKGRLQRFVARRRYAGPVLTWNEALARETLKDGDPAISQQNLQSICDEDAFPQSMRQDALRAQDRLRTGLWQPKHCYQHGDFWEGNILLSTAPAEPSFYVIDWAGMQPDGYPFLDLARMLMSMRCTSRLSASHIETLRNHVQCDHPDVLSYTLSGLGHIGRNLEHFPPHRYQSMAVKVYNFMKEHCRA